MSSALSSPFLADSIAEVVPDVAKVAGKLAQSSVITGRRRVRLVPQSGQNYSSGNSAGVINILIQDGSAYADLLSAVVSFELTVSDSNAGTSATTLVVPDDGAYSVFRRALISVNSTLMDDIDFLPKKVNAELYATASQDWYNTVGSWLGLWKNNTAEYGYLDGATAADIPELIPKYDVLRKIPIVNAKLATTGPGSTAGAPELPGTNKFAVPMSLLTSFFRNDTLFPSRNAGQLYVQLNIASAIESLITATVDGDGAVDALGIAGSQPNFSITNLTMELDYCDLHPTYLSMMDDLIESPGGVGVQWAFDAHMTATQNLAGSGGSAGQQSVVVSKASQNMRSLQVIVQPSAGLSSTNFFGQSCFNNPGFKDIQYRIGSLYFPAFTAVGEHRAYFDLQNAFGSPESVERSGLVDNFNYYLAVDEASPLSISSNNSGNGWTVANPGNNLFSASCSAMWMYAYCFDRLKHAKIHGVDLDGINTLTSAGSQMVVQLNCNPVGGLAQTMTSLVRFTRVLVLRNGATQVVG
jgi:hypothetical protein